MYRRQLLDGKPNDMFLYHIIDLDNKIKRELKKSINFEKLREKSTKQFLRGGK